MTGWNGPPKSKLIEMASKHRVLAMGLDFPAPDAMFFKVRYLRKAEAIFRIPAKLAIDLAAPISRLSTKQKWSRTSPQLLTIAEFERVKPPDLRDTVQSGQVKLQWDFLILVLGFENSLGLCLRVERNHAAWFADQILDARKRRLLAIEPLDDPTL
jgi:hypothetical protein